MGENMCAVRMATEQSTHKAGARRMKTSEMLPRMQQCERFNTSTQTVTRFQIGEAAHAARLRAEHKKCCSTFCRVFFPIPFLSSVRRAFSCWLALCVVLSSDLLFTPRTIKRKSPKHAFENPTLMRAVCCPSFFRHGPIAAFPKHLLLVMGRVDNAFEW